jgi:hypothetical protein
MSKASLYYALIEFCQRNKLTLIKEFRFNLSRRWKADYFIIELNCLIEFEGLGGKTKQGIGGHQTKLGYTSNCEKYNKASLMGFKLLRYTAINTNQCVNDLEILLKIKQ